MLGRRGTRSILSPPPNVQGGTRSGDTKREVGEGVWKRGSGEEGGEEGGIRVLRLLGPAKWHEGSATLLILHDLSVDGSIILLARPPPSLLFFLARLSSYPSPLSLLSSSPSRRVVGSRNKSICSITITHGRRIRGDGRTEPN